jgi:C_GCAxxG_C_C family probable redox protein
MSEVEKVLKVFDQGLNCSQAILSAYGGRFGLTEDEARMLGRAFGAGMGCQGYVCGALSGGMLVLGLAEGEGEEKEAKAKAYAVTRELFSFFQARHGSIQCRDILGENLGDAEGLRRVREAGLFNSICPGVLRTVCEFLSRRLGNPQN